MVSRWVTHRVEEMVFAFGRRAYPYPKGSRMFRGVGRKSPKKKFVSYPDTHHKGSQLLFYSRDSFFGKAIGRIQCVGDIRPRFGDSKPSLFSLWPGFAVPPGNREELLVGNSLRLHVKIVPVFAIAFPGDPDHTSLPHLSCWRG